MPLTKTMDWEQALDDAARAWESGNAAGVRAFYHARKDNMPADVLRRFADVLANEPKARAASRPRKQPKDTPGTVTVDYFGAPDNDLSRHVATLQRMGDESAARELLAQLERAHATGDKAFLREHDLHNKTDKSFRMFAREYVEGRYRVRLD